MTIPTTFADAKIQTDRLGELHQCLMAHSFALLWCEPGQYWAVRDDDIREPDAAVSE